MDASPLALPLHDGGSESTASDVPENHRPTIRSALERRGWRLGFDRVLEQAYERDTGAKRNKRVFVCNLVSIPYFWALSTLDLYKLPHVAQTLVDLRDAITAICTLLVLWQGLRLPRLTSLERDGLSAIGALLMCGYAAFEASQGRDVLGAMIGKDIMLNFVYVCLVARLSFPAALAVAVPMLVTFPLVAATPDPLMHAIVHNHVALFIGMATVSLAGAYVLERNERRAYLMERLAMLQQDAVRLSAEALRELTLRDPLTGLANRRHFDHEIGTLWHDKRSAATAVGLLQIDVDFFKHYNDCYGHPMGDACLRTVSDALDDVARAHGGFAARIGGEEFAVLLPGLDAAGAASVADQLCSAVRALRIPHRDSSVAPFVTVSVGVASTRPRDAHGPGTLVQAADRALYRAKHEGRNRTAQAEPTRDGPGTVDATARAADPTASEPAPAGPVARWRGLLASKLHTLRFPLDEETEYQERHRMKRQRWLAVLIVSSMVVTCGYVWLSLPLYSDIAPEYMRRTIFLCIGLSIPWAAIFSHPIPWYWREGMVSWTASVLALGLLLFEIESQSTGMQSGLIALSLVTVVASLIAAPPVRFCIPPCFLLCAAVGALTWTSDPADQARWLSAFAFLMVTSVYSLVGAYLLDLSNRRAYLLRRLGKAQLAELQTLTVDLQRAALTDALTGLPNRRQFESQQLALWEQCQRDGAPLALLIIDIDHFKLYNDHHGHPAGDACLQGVGGFILAWAAEQPAMPGQTIGAFAARLGGEEFGVLLPGYALAAALEAAQRLCAALRERRSPHVVSPVSEVLTASIGVGCQRRSDSRDLRQLLRAADEALYRAKAAGRNMASA